MVRTLIIDDENDARNVVKYLLSKKSDRFDVVGEASEVSQAVDLIREKKPDLIFLDLHLYNESGFDVLKQIDTGDISIIIVTGYDQYGIEAVKAGATDYILKPVDPKEFNLALRKVMETSEGDSWKERYDRFKEQKIQITIHNHRVKISLPDILYFKSDNNYSEVYLKNGSRHVLTKTLKRFETELEGCFFERCHQSYLVNVTHIDRVNSTGNTVFVKEHELPVSRRNKSKLLELFYTLDNASLLDRS